MHMARTSEFVLGSHQHAAGAAAQQLSARRQLQRMQLCIHSSCTPAQRLFQSECIHNQAFCHQSAAPVAAA